MAHTSNKATLGKLSREQINLLKELNSRNSMNSIEHSVKGVTLDWFQTKSLAHALITKGSIVSLDTGLGKTLVASGYINILMRMFPNKKFIYICERSNFDATLTKLGKHTNAKVIGTTAEGEVVWNDFMKKDPLQYDVWVLTYQALHNLNVNHYLFRNRESIISTVIDESHKIGNDDSITYQLIRGLCKDMPYLLFLTATPLRVSPRQMVNQIEILDRSMFEDKEKYCRRFEDRDLNGQVTGYHSLEIMSRDLQPRFISYTRQELGLRGNYNVRLVLADPKDEYFDIDRTEMNQIIKADPDGDAIFKLMVEVYAKAQQGKRGLIYANLNGTKQLLLRKLKEIDIRVGIIDGSLSDVKKRSATQEAFNNGEYDVLIINVTTALDLPCDYIIFYELTVDSKQMIGRGERGLKANDLELVYIISAMTVEVDYFIENVYNRGVLLKTLAHKEIQELESVRSQLRTTGQYFNFKNK